MRPGLSLGRCPFVGWRAAMCVLPLALVVAGSLSDAQEVTSTAVALSRAVAKGGTISVWLVILNTSDHPISHTFQSALDGRLRAGTTDQGVPLELRNPAEAGEVMIPAGGYVRREYAAALPEGLRGPVILSAEGVPANPVVVEMEKPQAVAAVPEAKPTAPPSPLPKSTDYDAEAFFREHVFGYEPAYFIAGTKSPNAKFQISFKYRFFSEHGSFVQKYPPLKGFHLAYTQTSLWDWNAPSAPFLDTSYKPEFFYAMERVDKGRWGEAVRLDLQGGGQHESNGKGGADSRSLNIVYVQPTFVVGKKGGLQLSLAPRLWAYVGSLDDNPDIARFRGYVGLRAVAGWADSLQLSASGRVGSAWDRGSLQLDLTYPLRLFTENFGLYLHLQYFWGYGETLLRYNDRTSSIRAGFSLYR